jgi:23S rRNA pseudouridine1911/1915/1917 synthase
LKKHSIRPGIVHRLDKQTSGLLIIAKNDQVYNKLSEELKEKKIIRNYVAIVCGKLTTPQGSINAPLSKNYRLMKQQISFKNGIKAITEFKVLSGNNNYTFVRCQLQTGRMHQIRIHLKFIGFPIYNDPIYNKQ